MTDCPSPQTSNQTLPAHDDSGVEDEGGRLPDFLILGEMKCGTTTLWASLGQHPQVFFSDPKELHFFSSYPEMGEVGRYETDEIARYAAKFADAEANQRCGEATPNYLADPNAPGRIAAALGEPRLIVMLRDPVKRAWSHYWHRRRRGDETLSFRRALEAEPERLEQGDASQCARYAYVARGRYIEGLRRYEQQFGRQSLCVLCLEDLQADPGSAMSRVYQHLQITPPAQEPDSLPRENIAQYPKSAGLDRLTRQVRQWTEACGPVLAKPARALADLTRPMRVYHGAPRMDPDDRQRLETAFEQSDAELAQWLERPLPWRVS